MKETELKPCPFCGGNDLTIKDNTNMVYGFDGYEIRCRCGCRFASGSVHDHYWQGKKYCTPITENSKKIAYDKMIEDWNRRSDNEKK